MSRARSVANLGNQNVLDLNASTGSLSVGSGTTIENSGEAQFAGIVTAVQFSGDIIGVAATFSGNVSIAGTLTYEDVTSIDSVGVITARNGIDVGTGASISSPADNILALGTNSQEALRISSSGQVGIGTTGSGDAALVVSGVSTFTNSDQTLLVLDETTGGDPDVGGIIGLQGLDSDGTPRTLAAIKGGKRLSGSDFDGYLALYTRRHAVAELNERLRIAAGGNVGVGITNPQAKFEVNEPTYGASGDNLAAITIGTSSTITAFAVEKNGQVSIGKSSYNGEQIVSVMTNSGAPVAIYTQNFNSSDVAGNIYNLSSPDNYTAQKGELLIEGTQPGRVKEEGQAWGIRFHQGDGSGTDATDRCTAAIHAIRETSTDGSTALSFKTRSGTGGLNNRLIIKSDGNIGLGSTTPRTGLDLHKSTEAAARISFSQSGVNVRNNYIGLDNDPDTLAISVDQDNQGTNSHFKLRVDGSETIYATDKVVHIGDSSTWINNAYIDAAGSVSQQASASSGDGSISAPWVYTSAIEAVDERGTGSCGIILGEHGATNTTTGAADNIIMWTDGVDRLSINASGTVTIPGTLAVRTAIDLADSDELRFGSGDDAKIYHDGSHLYVDMNYDDDIYIRDVNSSNATRLWFDTSAGDLNLWHQIYAGRSDGNNYQTGVSNAIGTYARDSGNQAADEWTARTRILADWRGSANETTNENTAIIMSECKDRAGNIWPVYKMNPSGGSYQRASSSTGIGRNSTTNAVTSYYAPGTQSSAGFWAYMGKAADTDRLYSSNYWARAVFRNYPSNSDLNNADDRSALEIGWGGQTDSGNLDLDQGVRAKISGAGRGEFVQGVWAGKVEADEDVPNSLYYAGEASVTTYAGNGTTNIYGLHTNHNGYTQITGRNTVDTDNVFYAYVNGSPRIRFQADGNGRFDGSADIGDADYAEMFEWSDGNPNNEDRRGYSVVLVGEQIRPATSSDDPADILGIISGSPGVLGDSASLNWNSRYLRDEFGTKITVDKEYLVWNRGYEFDESQPMVEVQMQYGEDEDMVETVMRHPKVPVAQPNPNDKNSLDGCERWPIEDIDNTTAIPQYARDNNIRAIYKELVENPDYDPNAAYVPRRDRQEWDPVGMLGKLTLRKGQPTGAGWRKLSDINDTLERWLVR